MKKLTVYILECSDGSYYTGVTNNLELRLKQHNAGIDKDAYTYSRRPIKLMWYEVYSPPGYAIEMEKKIKKWSRAKKKALIDEAWDKLPMLSKKKNFRR